MSAVPLPELGPEVSQHRYRLLNAFLLLVGAGVFLLLAVILLGLGIHGAFEKRDYEGLAIATGMAAFFSLPGLWLLYLGGKGLILGAVITVHEGGVSKRTRLGTQSIRWEEMTALRIDRVSRRGRPAHEAFDNIYIKKGREKLDFGESSYGHIPDDVLDLLRERSMLAMLPVFEQRLKAGERLVFGDVSLTSTEVGLRKDRFGFSELGGWRFQETDLVLFPKEGKPRRARIFGADNTQVLFQLLARRVPLRPV